MDEPVDDGLEVLEAGIELPSGEKVDLLGGKLRDATILWPAIEDVFDGLFSDTSGVTDRASFIGWFEEWVPYCVIAIAESGECASCAYVTDLVPGEKATFHAFSAKDFRQSKVTELLGKKAVDYVFDKLGLRKLEAIGRNDNRVARITALILGFITKGTLSKYKVHGGENNDYFVKEIAR